MKRKPSINHPWRKKLVSVGNKFDSDYISFRLEQRIYESSGNSGKFRKRHLGVGRGGKLGYERIN